MPRSYFYDVDVHGQLFLSTAKHRNVATAYRDPRFLDTFFARLRRNATLETEEAKDARAGGFEFVSECMGEINYVRPDRDGTALVFQALEGQGAASCRAGGVPCPALGRDTSAQSADCALLFWQICDTAVL